MGLQPLHLYQAWASKGQLLAGGKPAVAAQQRPEGLPQEEVAQSGSDWADAADEAEVPAPVHRSASARMMHLT